MEVGLVRSLQPPDILWIHWRVYNFIANTSKGVLFLPPSDAYVRSFLYLLYTLIKLYYTKALSVQASSLAPDWILLLQRPRIPASFVFQQQHFIYHILIILAIFQTFSLLLYLLWWFVINDLPCFSWKKIRTYWRLRWCLAFFSNKVVLN